MWHRHDVTKVGDFYNGGLWGNSFSFVGSSWNCVSSYIKKRWHTSWKFQLEILSNKKVIAKKPLTNLYEMNSKSIETPETFKISSFQPVLTVFWQIVCEVIPLIISLMSVNTWMFEILDFYDVVIWFESF